MEYVITACGSCATTGADLAPLYDDGICLVCPRCGNRYEGWRGLEKGWLSFGKHADWGLPEGETHEGEER